MTDSLKGKPVVVSLKEQMKQEILGLEAEGIQPTMGILRVGNRPDDIAYENSIIKNCDSIGMRTQVFEVDKNIHMEAFKELFHKINDDKYIHGVLLFRPLPLQLDMDVIKYLIDPQKDIDCIHPMNQQKVFEGAVDGFLPCTPEAVMEMLKYYQISLQGKNIVVINRSMVLGKPLAMMLLAAQATVTICHSKTRNLPEITSKADIVITGVGRARFFKEEYFHQDAVVIDVGINDGGNDKICGDVDDDRVHDKVKAITPVPGGVGTVTTAILLRHVLEACKKQI
ncbi:bifunctional 5,10-methylenetetrahydrofolate dehydrogenase/5,10-methenyltetrahydrofolate cyclohydrolase [Clostridiaceae bacterium 35-E11]